MKKKSYLPLPEQSIELPGLTPLSSKLKVLQRGADENLDLVSQEVVHVYILCSDSRYVEGCGEIGWEPFASCANT